MSKLGDMLNKPASVKRIKDGGLRRLWGSGG